MTMNGSAGEFFNRAAKNYGVSRRGGMRAFHRISAGKIESALHGNVLCVGGVWTAADLDSLTCSVTVADLSEKMLGRWQEQGVETIVCDARELPFEEESFDHVVMPLVLHHITGSTGPDSRRQATRALSEARRVLRQGGQLWISEFEVSRVVYGLEILAAPLTKTLLSLVGIPLVIMHDARFYEQALVDLGFEDIKCERITSAKAGPFDMIQPVIGLRFFLVPRFLYPVRPFLVTARC